MGVILQIYHDSLCPLEKNPMAGVVSPPLMGSHGVLPLTIVAPLPDICRHMSNCIARAEREVFLATNFWIHSHASTLVTNAFRELSRRAGQRGTKVVVKVVYDRGAPQQVWENHLNVHEKDFAGEKVKLPAPEEIPNIDLQVINYHRPIFGTFHAKFMIVDRRVALLQSNNIQDNDNLEMMVRLEGPIVDSLYDSALVSWGRPLGALFHCLRLLPDQYQSRVGQGKTSTIMQMVVRGDPCLNTLQIIPNMIPTFSGKRRESTPASILSRVSHGLKRYLAISVCFIPISFRKEVSNKTKIPQSNPTPWEMPRIATRILR